VTEFHEGIKAPLSWFICLLHKSMVLEAELKCTTYGSHPNQHIGHLEGWR